MFSGREEFKGGLEVFRTESVARSYGRRGRLVGRVETVTVTTVERAPEKRRWGALALKGFGALVFWAVTNPDKVLDLLAAFVGFGGGGGRGSGGRRYYPRRPPTLSPKGRAPPLPPIPVLSPRIFRGVLWRGCWCW